MRFPRSIQGTPNFTGGAATSSLTVKPASTSSTTVVTSSSNPSTAGQSVTLTATITAPGTSSGSVAFYDGRGAAWHRVGVVK
jgi:hypothetical protein